MLKQLQKQRKDNQSGFTIIEVMIVLAIAGVIMMLVFLAIPALQRNNRNTQLRSDVANVMGYISEYTSNNNGATPIYVGIETNNPGVVVMGDSDTSNNEVGSIRAGTLINQSADADAFDAATTDTETIYLVTGYGCDGEDGEPGAGSRSIAALYRVETAGAPQAQCQAN